MPHTMFSDTLPAQLDAAPGTDPWADFRVDHPGEALALLRQVRDAAAPVIVATAGGASMSCTLWTLDTVAHRMNLSADASSPLLEAIVNTDEATCVSYLDHVKLQFDIDQLVLVRGAKSAALQCAMPDVLYRFQRRGSYRVRPATRHAPRLSLRHPAMPEITLQLRVLDISAGGCALLLPRDMPELRPGVLVHDARMQLDDETEFFVSVQLQHISSLPAQEQGLRIGCEWHRPSAAATRALQRYVDLTQKRRRLMSLP